LLSFPTALFPQRPLNHLFLPVCAFVLQEIATLQMVRHKNIIALIDHLPDGEQDDKHWVIMQLATGGELMQRIIQKFQNNMRYTEKEVKQAQALQQAPLCVV
jgi:serine/threonine protein kinase